MDGEETRAPARRRPRTPVLTVLAKRTYWPLYAAVLVLAVTIGLLAGTDRGDDRPTAHVGQVIYAGSAHTTRNTVLVLPGGPLSVAVGDPVGELASAGTTDAVLRAPAGGRLVTLATKWNQPTTTNDVPAFVGLAQVQPAGTRLFLVADGHDYPVRPDPDRQPAGGTSSPLEVQAAVAVAGHPSDLGVAVVYGGQRIAADLTKRTYPGRSVSYEDQPKKVACGTSTVTAPYRRDDGRDDSCSVTFVGSVPYLPDLGWARDDREWLVVRVAVNPNLAVIRSDLPGISWGSQLSRYSTTATLDGGAPRLVGDIDIVGSGSAFVWDVPSGATTDGHELVLTVHHPRMLRSSDDGVTATGPLDPDVDSTWRVALR
jgi:hypothetical protein